ncbi:hypothetical protein F511_25327 [Dorcoceras hygrometricum]|uniref:Uncharacterized protein n=1 Tax=Dorcoceras hygrometricum TaxID=472368 RepID=A0A2Z7AZ58_9LAMI|nr:hypothetical protein F511_25327 [Dorcoceras hygrometricum]
MGSNSSTESSYKTAVNSKNKMQMLCMQPGTTAEGYNQGREPKNSMHSSTEFCNRICGHDESSHSVHRGNESAESPLASHLGKKTEQQQQTKAAISEWNACMQHARTTNITICNTTITHGPRDLDCNLLNTHNRSQAQHRKSRPTIETHGWESFTPPVIKSNNTTNRKLKQRLILRSQQQFEVLLNAATHGRRQQLRDFALANDSLPEGYQSKELFERSPTLPQTSKTVAGNDGNCRRKATMNSILGFEAKNTIGEKYR